MLRYFSYALLLKFGFVVASILSLYLVPYFDIIEYYAVFSLDLYVAALLAYLFTLGKSLSQLYETVDEIKIKEIDSLIRFLFIALLFIVFLLFVFGFTLLRTVILGICFAFVDILTNRIKARSMTLKANLYEFLLKGLIFPTIIISGGFISGDSSWVLFYLYAMFGIFVGLLVVFSLDVSIFSATTGLGRPLFITKKIGQDLLIGFPLILPAGVEVFFLNYGLNPSEIVLYRFYLLCSTGITFSIIPLGMFVTDNLTRNQFRGDHGIEMFFQKFNNSAAKLTLIILPIFVFAAITMNLVYTFYLMKGEIHYTHIICILVLSFSSIINVLVGPTMLVGMFSSFKLNSAVYVVGSFVGWYVLCSVIFMVFQTSLLTLSVVNIMFMSTVHFGIYRLIRRRLKVDINVFKLMKVR